MANQVLDILIYLHELSPPVLHRDIKPSNLILGEDKQVYLVDFGAVQAQAAVTGVTFTVVGTSGYAPLEQFWGRAVAASDLYALGATLIHLLTGIAPADLPQKEGRIYFRDSLRDSFASRLSLDSHFIAWIEQMTEIVLEKRFSTAKEAMESLRYGLIQQSSSTSLPVRGRLSKPSGSLIQLKANKDKLGITIPSPGLRKLTQYNWLLALIVVSFNLGSVWTLINLLFISKELLINGLPILLALIGITSLWIHHLGTKTHVFFDRNRNSLEIERQLLFLKYGYQRLDITDIGNAFLMGRGSTYEIRIPSANYIYKLGGALGEKESTWLLQ
ncbi:MAG: hypothetical protein RIM23_03305 [Coleofasciculus sp. G3-WIS-01]